MQCGREGVMQCGKKERVEPDEGFVVRQGCGCSLASEHRSNMHRAWGPIPHVWGEKLSTEVHLGTLCRTGRKLLWLTNLSQGLTVPHE